MAGRIQDDDVALVRERSPIDRVVADYVTLRGAGSGELKGLCPFHEEKSPSFHVSPGRALFYCFGCGEGGDVITFLRKIENLSFAEAVERLAGKAGVELHYEGGTAGVHRSSGVRTRIVEAHTAAVAFYAERLATDPTGEPARAFLKERGFDEAVAKDFSIGFAPDARDVLVRHLTAKGFSREELTTAGLASVGQHGVFDYFRGRLLFPIRDASGSVVGFGGRALADGQTPKYLNTRDTPAYKKSSVLYGLERARADIGRQWQAVVVEGYTDVMACHLAGVTTAVATCGTSLTTDHIAVLRRLLMDQDEFRGEVIFTFDGDAAGQKAALRAFENDDRFVTQTFVAVEPSGKDPCELRVSGGDAAVRDLVARRVPLFEFKLRNLLDQYDLEIPEGRVRALAAAVPVVAGIRDRALRPEYARWLAGRLGMDVEEVLRQVGTGGRTSQARRRPEASGQTEIVVRPDPNDLETLVERETLKCALQRPGMAGADWDALDPELWTVPAYRACRDAVMAAGGVAGRTDAEAGAIVAAVREAAPDDEVRGLLTELAVEPMRAMQASEPAYVRSQIAALQVRALTRSIQERKGRLQRVNPVEHPKDYDRLFGELLALEAQHRALREASVGDTM